MDAKDSIKLSLSDMVLVLHRSTLYDHSSLLLLFSMFFLGFAFHSMIDFVSSFQNKKLKGGGGGEEAKCVLRYFLGFEIKVGQFIFI